MTSALLDAPRSTISHPAPKLLLAVAVALVGDRLLYDRAAGISLVLFLTLTAGAAWAANRSRAGRRDIAVALLVLIAGLAPLVESAGALSFAFAGAGLALYVVILTGALARGLRVIVASAASLALFGPFDLFPDSYEIADRAMRSSHLPRAATLLGWIVPIVLSGVFAVLFASANPLIDGWISGIPWSALVPGFDLPRILFWVVLLAIVWACVVPRLAPRLWARPRAAVDGTTVPGAGATPAIARRLLEPATVLRCLVLFNLLFAVQSATDLLYLWGGLALPPGLTYAAYAHRGAYPLIVTALLAAAFVVVALRPGGAGENAPAIRTLVYLWIAQNVLLVASAMLRLDLYVSAYGLTILRLVALIWMGLVAVGLLLILARIVLRRSNGWLVGANALALVATLYVCAFLNVAGLVADYNARHRSGLGDMIDLPYAMSLGAQAIPAVDRILAGNAGPVADRVASWRSEHATQLRTRMQDWHAWTFRDQRLLDYLAAYPEAPVPGAASGEGPKSR